MAFPRRCGTTSEGPHQTAAPGVAFAFKKRENENRRTTLIKKMRLEIERTGTPEKGKRSSLFTNQLEGSKTAH